MQKYAWVGTLVALTLAASAGAATVQFDFPLDGLQEVPPVATPGSGSATVILNTDTGEISVSGTFQDLIGTTTASHIHGLAAAGANAGIVLPLTITGGVTSGTVTGNGTLTAPQVQGVLDGLTYLNIHTSFKPGGEIRGQVVPEPTSLGLLALAGLLMRRR